jgi:hypothetical protein
MVTDRLILQCEFKMISTEIITVDIGVPYSVLQKSLKKFTKHIIL